MTVSTFSECQSCARHLLGVVQIFPILKAMLWGGGYYIILILQRKELMPRDRVADGVLGTGGRSRALWLQSPETRGVQVCL